MRKKLSFRNKLMLGFLAVAILPVILIGAYSYYQSKNTLEDQILQTTYQSLSQATSNISARLKQVESVSNLITGNTQILEMLMDSEQKSPYERLLDFNIIRPFIDNLRDSSKVLRIRIYINNEYAYTNEGRDIYHISRLTSEDTGEPVETLGNNLIWRTVGYKTDENEAEQQVITAFRVIRYWATNEISFIYFIDILEEEIADMYRSFQQPDFTDTYIADDDGGIVSSLYTSEIGVEVGAEMQDIFSSTGESGFLYGNRLVLQKELDITEWIITTSISVPFLNTKTRPILSISILIIVIIVGVSAVISILLSRGLTKKLNLLLNVVKSDKKEFPGTEINNGTKMLEEGGNDEIDDLLIRYNRQVNRIMNLREELFQAHIEETEAELMALQANINPHFLYNSLDSVNSCLEGNRNKEAGLMLSSLSKFFRIALSKGKSKIRIEKEMEMISSYLDIQKMNYGNLLDWVINIDERILPFLIPRFTLQPIVENAILHGLLKREEKGLVRISGFFDDEFIVLKVNDNGPGIKQIDLKIIQEIIDKKVVNPEKGYGLMNVNSRLKLNFGQSSGLLIHSGEDCGTTLEIRIAQEL